MTTAFLAANRTDDALSTGTPDALPPGPRLPATLQTLLFWRHSHRFLPSCRARYGDVFTLRVAPVSDGLVGTYVVICRPEDIRRVFSGPASVFHAGKGNAIFRRVMGENSLLLLDGDRHQEQRRRLVPPFHGDALRRYTGVIEDLATAEVGSWPIGRPFAVHPRMQALALEVILHAVFGPATERLGALRPRLSQPLGGMTSLACLFPALERLGPWRAYRRLSDETDELLLAEIRRHREGGPGGGDPDAVLSRLLSTDGPDEAAPSDQELRDQLITLLLTGHDSTATSLAWTLHELVHRPEALRRARQAADAGDEEYLDAVVKEALRLRPVVYNIARRLTAPVDVAGYRLPAGVVVVPSIGLAHLDPEQYDEPHQFRPERFLGSQPPAHGWIPFGGGVRRCPGAELALLEARTVLGVVLRGVDLAPATRRPDRAKARHVTLAPGKGTRIVVTTRRDTYAPQWKQAASRELAGTACPAGH